VTVLVPGVPLVVQAGPVQLLRVSAPAGRVLDPSMPAVAVNLLLRTPPLQQVGFNRRPRWLVTSPGTLIAAPADTEAEFVADAPSEVLAMMMPTPHVAEHVDGRRRRVAILREEAFRDPRLAAGLEHLWSLVADDAPGFGLLADQVMRDAIDVLAARSDAPAGGSRAREHLASHTVRRVRDFVESRLGGELDVPMLAAAAGTSPAHFARAFAATVGMSPYRYVMTRRLAMARDLLERTTRPAQAIAFDVGFRTASHLSARFRREFGVAPSAVRNRRRHRTG
jgi:AraC family transcriptional regulator